MLHKLKNYFQEQTKEMKQTECQECDTKNMIKNGFDDIHFYTAKSFFLLLQKKLKRIAKSLLLHLSGYA